jgi:hypothetical protein
MDHSEQKHLKLKKTRKVVGLPESSHRGYDADDLPKCNWNALAATIIENIRYNTKTHKRRKAASHAYWCEFFKGCPEQTVRTAIRDAEASHLLKITKAMFNGSNTKHYLYVGPGVETNIPPVEFNTPPVEINGSNTEVITKVIKDENLNIQNATTQTAVATTACPVKPDKAPGKTKASEPFLALMLKQKREYLATGPNSDNPAGNLLPDLTPADLCVCQRLEYRLVKAGVDAVAFATWLTPAKLQKLTLDIDWTLDYPLLWMGKKAAQVFLIDAYRTELAAPLEVATSPVNQPAVAPAPPAPTTCSLTPSQAVVGPVTEDDYEDMAAAMGEEAEWRDCTGDDLKLYLRQKAKEEALKPKAPLKVLTAHA